MGAVGRGESTIDPILFHKDIHSPMLHIAGKIMDILDPLLLISF
jgi:hypothetical protein